MLDGVRIVDTSRLLPGPYATWLLATMGADVVKVEQPGRGDYIRHNWPRRGGTSNVFHLYNHGKRSVALNLKHEEGVAAFLDLVASADVVVDGNRPGVLDRLGCGWDECRARNPALVFAAITGFGQDGPYRDRVGHDVNYLSIAGMLSAFADGGGHPVLPRVTIADMAGGGLMAAVGILGALFGAKKSGVGRFVDVSITDSMVSMQGLRLAENLVPGDPRPTEESLPDDNDWEYGVYRTADDRFVSIDPYEQRFKLKLWGIIEAEGCGSAPVDPDGPAAVRAALGDAIRQRPLARWVELMGEEEVCFAPVHGVADLPDDPYVKARGLLGDALSPDVASPGLGSPLRFEPPVETDPTDADAPRLGGDTAALLRALGWSPDRIEAAAASAAIEADDDGG